MKEKIKDLIIQCDLDELYSIQFFLNQRINDLVQRKRRIIETESKNEKSL